MLFDLPDTPALPDEPTVTRAILELIGRGRERGAALAQGKRRAPVLTSRAVAESLALPEDHRLVVALLSQLARETFAAGFGVPTTVQDARAIARRLLYVA